MKKPTLAFAALAWLVLGIACNNSGEEKKVTNEVESLSKTAPAGVDKNVTDVESSNKNVPAAVTKPASKCCFANMDECRQFLPISGEHIKQVVSTDPETGELICSEDVDTPNSVTQLYTAGSGKLTLKISDYCISPAKAAVDYDRKYKTTLAVYPKDREVKELADPNGRFKGFAVYSPSDKSSYLHAVVDGRFKVTIAGSGQDKFSHILDLWSTLPVDKLAAFKK